MAEQQAALQGLDLEIAQYQAAHHPVSLADLASVRGQRNDLWGRIKTGVLALAAAAPDYEARVADADALSDQRHDKAQEASSLQSKLDERERLAMQLATLQTRAEENAQAQAAFADARRARWLRPWAWRGWSSPRSAPGVRPGSGPCWLPRP